MRLASVVGVVARGAGGGRGEGGGPVTFLRGGEGSPMPRTWLIGCGPDCHLVVNRPLVASHHCRLARHADGVVVLEDLGSPGGTFVNGRRITGATRVTPGDVVMLGPD